MVPETRYVVSAMVGVVVLVSLIVVGLQHSGGDSSATSVGTGGSAPAAPAVPAPTRQVSPVTSPSVTAPLTTTQPAASQPTKTQPIPGRPTPGQPAAGGGPTITGFDPNHGAPGQQVDVTGTGFMSSDGNITAYFGGQSASTSCPTPTTCTVVVPQPPPGAAAGAVQVTIVTASGRSNAVTFTYD